MQDDTTAFYREPGAWYRGNLHCHSTESDGKHAPLDVAKWYRERGYDFLSLTDHRKLTPLEGLDGLLCIPGVEINTTVGRTDRHAFYHVVGIGVSETCELTRQIEPQALIDTIRDSGGMAFIAHPKWSGNIIDAEFLALHDYLGIECFNFASEAENNTGLSVAHWDMLLLQGKKTLGFATDDSHALTNDAGGGWIMVKAPALTSEAILGAIKAGRFYASSGPEILDIRVEEGEVHVRCSPAQAIHFMTGGEWGISVKSGEAGTPVTEGTWRIHPRAPYVRIEVVDDEHRVAWSNPIYLKGDAA